MDAARSISSALDNARAFARAVARAGGRALVVGGAVRDRLLGLTPTDVDVEVFGLSAEQVSELAREMGAAQDVGKTFGVLEVRFPGSTLHLSLPRRESKVAAGHRGFAVAADPTMAPEDAARRRDFTINAIAEDPLTGEVLDPFHGRDDLQRKLLRVVDAATFGDDPLRVLRGAVFAAQFELAVESATDRCIRATVSSLRELPRERIGAEWQKLLLRSLRPSLGMQLLMDWGVLEVLHPDFVPLATTPQSPKWHPEGGVWTHTLMAIDEAAVMMRSPSLRGGSGVTNEAISRSTEESKGLLRPFGSRNDKLSKEDQWHVLLATLCHDLGKATTTVEERGVLRSRGHDAAGVEPARRFLKSIAADRRTIEVVVRLVREHLMPLRCFNLAARGTPVSDGEIRSLARRLHPATIFLLTLVADADHQGRGPFYGEQGRTSSGEPRRTIPVPAAAAGERLRERAAALGVLQGPPAPVLRGADLVVTGCAPGPEFGTILRRAQKLHDAQGISRDELLARLKGARSSEEALARLS